MLYIIWFIILIGDCHHPRTGNPIPHRLKGFTMSPGTPLLVQQLLHDGLKPIQLQISSLYMRIYIYTHITLYGMQRSVFYTLYTVYAHMYNIHIQLYIYIHIHVYYTCIYIYTYVYILSIYIYTAVLAIKQKQFTVRQTGTERGIPNTCKRMVTRGSAASAKTWGNFGQNHVRN